MGRAEDLSMRPEVREIYDVLVARPEIRELMKLAIEKNLTAEQIDGIIKCMKERAVYMKGVRQFDCDSAINKSLESSTVEDTVKVANETEISEEDEMRFSHACHWNGNCGKEKEVLA